MKKVFIKVVNGNHQECIDYLASLGATNPHRPVEEDAGLYCIDEHGSIEWMHNYEWFLMEGYTEIFLPETTPSKRHHHYDLIVQWASDVSQKVWWSPDKSGWAEVEMPTWVADYHYHIGETPPPNLDPVLLDDACKNTVYYVVNPVSAILYFQYSNFQDTDKHLFDRKLVYSTPEGAIKRAKEMLGMAD